MASLPTDTAALTDEQLIGALRDGDEAAFQLLIERYHASLLQLALSFFSEPSDAATSVREAVRDMLQSLGSFDGRQRVGAWLFGFVIRQCRARSPLPQTEEPLGPSMDPALFRGADEPYYGGWRAFPAGWGDAPDQRLDSGAALTAMRGALRALPRAQQRVVLLRDVHGCTAAETSEVLDITETLQHALLNRGRSRLRQTLASFLTGER